MDKAMLTNIWPVSLERILQKKISSECYFFNLGQNFQDICNFFAEKLQHFCNFWAHKFLGLELQIAFSKLKFFGPEIAEML